MSSEAPENPQSAALRRSEAYLAETQRLTRTGSFTIEVATQALRYSSAEHSRLYGFDPAQGLPSLEDFFGRIHPDDRAMCREAMSEAIRELTDVEVEYCVLVPGSAPRIIHAFGHPVPGASGEAVEIVGTIVDVTERREAEAQTARVAEEQAALRRVATLVATEAPPAEVLGKVAEEVAHVIGDVDISLWRDERDGTATIVASHGNVMAPATRLATDGDEVIAPILVGGRVWGALGAARTGRAPLAPGTETKLGQFAELVAIAIANAQARTEVERLADEQAALRRVATLVARGIGAEPIFQAVADEARALLACDNAAVVRFEADGTVTTMGARNASRRPGTRIVPDPRYVVAAVRATGRAARFDTDDPLAPGLPDAVRAEGIRTALASPIVVDGELWGTMTVGRTGDEVLPPEAEARLEKLAELIATAVGNAESREALSRLAEDQAALQRVATLVARGVEPAELFAAVSREVGRMFGSDMATVGRWDPDGPAHIIVGLVKPMAGLEVGSRLPLTATTAAAAVYRTGRSARTDAPFSAVAREMKAVSGVSSPVVVEGRPWGVISVASREPLPHDAEQRLEKFTELVATAVANAESRMALSRLADEQAALRRVATLVAHGASPAAVFDAVAAEMHALLQADGGLTMCRYEQDGELTIVAHRGAQEPQLQPGTRIRHDDPHSVTAAVRRTGQPARQDTYADTHGSIGHVIERLRFRSGVGVPILVDGRVWGVTVANWMGEQPPPPDTERRMAQFGELLDTAIANADGRDQLNASRARLLTTADDVRRRVVRDLHDGAQQRLVHGIVSLKLARRALPDDDGELRSLVEEALEHVELGNAELRELARGILPANLTHSGLRAAIRTVVSRLDLPVRVEVPDQRFPAEVEASAYFTVAEALTNVLKHAEATSAEVTASATDVALRIEVRDDGIGGADPDGAGLLGLRDRAAALGGWVTIESPADGGTVLAATLPLTRG